MAEREKEIQKYLESLYSKPVKVLSVKEIGGEGGKDIKGFGYGKPYFIDFEVTRQSKSAVLSTMRVQKGFGHDHFSDRAGIILWQNAVFNSMPKHARSIDAGFFTKGGELKSAGSADEFFILMERIAGAEYYKDLDRIRDTGQFGSLDLDRARALAVYLSSIHAKKHDDPVLYHRRIRELIGSGECIMGLDDSYPDSFSFYSRKDFERLEKECVAWRWKLRQSTGRLCQVHGDFHPWNIMFRDGTDFSVLDRSRGEYGEAADDVACMSLNYLFYSLQKYGRLEGEFKSLFDTFLDSYLVMSKDRDILKYVAPFYVFRALVVASPLWYPTLSPEVREKLFNFIDNVLKDETFDYRNVNKYLARR